MGLKGCLDIFLKTPFVNFIEQDSTDIVDALKLSLKLRFNKCVAYFQSKGGG